MSSEMLRRLLTYIDDHICEKISLVEMAELAGYSPFYFSKGCCRMGEADRRKSG